nr:immunoglobulin heavy chain junction region [Mus musculus]
CARAPIYDGRGYFDVW